MASKDLDKLMGKLKKTKKPSKKQEEDLKQKDDEFEDDLEEEDQETDEVTSNETDEEEVMSHEVALLQNDGIFRRELLMVLKDLVNVQKVTAQTLIDIKSKFDEDDGKGK